MFWEDVPAPNKQCETLAELGKLYCLVFLIFVISKSFVLGINMLLSDLISCLIFFMGVATFDSCYMALFVFFTFLPVIDHFSTVGLRIQRGLPLFKPALQAVQNSVMFVSFAMYLVGWWLAYKCYKEFKASAYGLPAREGWQNPEYASLRQQDDEEGGQQGRRRNGQYNSQQNGNFTAFQGQGVSIG